MRGLGSGWQAEGARGAKAPHTWARTAPASPGQRVLGSLLGGPKRPVPCSCDIPVERTGAGVWGGSWAPCGYHPGTAAFSSLSLSFSLCPVRVTFLGMTLRGPHPRSEAVAWSWLPVALPAVPSTIRAMVRADGFKHGPLGLTVDFSQMADGAAVSEPRGRPQGRQLCGRSWAHSGGALQVPASIRLKPQVSQGVHVSLMSSTSGWVSDGHRSGILMPQSAGSSAGPVRSRTG